MTRKCKYCGGALTFDPDIQMMVCDYCTSMFVVEETEEEKALSEEELSAYGASERILAKEEGVQMPRGMGSTLEKQNVRDDFLECEIYECTSCGAKLVINEVETATYCAFCGQPTIVFKRIAKRRRPDYIIPFSITKNEAIVNIREQFFKGKYVPDEIKFFQPDLLRGIYIPFMLYDIRYRDKQLIRGRTKDKDGDDSTTTYCYREAAAGLENIPVDASDRLPNELSERLEPFYLNAMVDFKVAYLSGYYADLMDSDTSQLKSIVVSRAREMFWERMQKHVGLEDCQLLKCNPQYVFEKEQYVLFPVWFMVFHEGNREYTILVNGQTGKVVGGLPPSHLKTLVLAIVLCTLFGALGAYLTPMLAGFDADLRGWINFFFVFGTPAILAGGLRNVRSLRKSMRLTTHKSTRDFVTERQDS